MSGTRVSVVINTLNRAGGLDGLLRELARQDYGDFEVIVVNGPSTDHTGAVLAAWADRIRTADCPRANLSESRNIGLAHARGELVVFIDDDARPERADWLRRFAARFTDRPRLGTVGGGVRNAFDGTWEFRDGVFSDYGVQEFERHPTAPVPDGVRWFQSIPGGNQCCRLEALRAIGGFDAFYAYYLDETDMALRLARDGWEVEVDPENSILHKRAAGERRSGRPLDYNWRVILRSDTRFALKNGADPLPVRIAKTFWKLPQKHFWRETREARRCGEISRRDLLRYRTRMAAGFAAGFWGGVFGGRQTGIPRVDAGEFRHFPLDQFHQSPDGRASA